MFDPLSITTVNETFLAMFAFSADDPEVFPVDVRFLSEVESAVTVFFLVASPVRLDSSVDMSLDVELLLRVPSDVDDPFLTLPPSCVAVVVPPRDPSLVTFDVVRSS